MADSVSPIKQVPIVPRAQADGIHAKPPTMRPDQFGEVSRMFFDELDVLLLRFPFISGAFTVVHEVRHPEHGLVFAAATGFHGWVDSTILEGILKNMVDHHLSNQTQN